MTETEKLTKGITSRLPKLNTKQLRTILFLIYEYLKTNGHLEGGAE